MSNPVTRRRVVLFVCVMAAWTVLSPATDQKARLGGRWNFDPAVSDDSAASIKVAQGQSEKTIGSYPTSPGTHPGAYPGVGVDTPIGGIGGARVGDPDGTTPGEGRPPINGGVENYPTGNSGDPGTPGRRGGPAEQGSSGTAGNNPKWGWLTQNPKFLQIDQQGKQIVVTNDAGQARTYYPDGKKHEGSDPQGNKTSTKARWEGNSLVAETRIANSGLLTETFHPGENGNQLYIKTLFESPSLQGPISIRRVYDLATPPPK